MYLFFFTSLLKYIRTRYDSSRAGSGSRLASPSHRRQDRRGDVAHERHGHGVPDLVPRAFRVRLERLREAHQPPRFARRAESRPARALAADEARARRCTRSTGGTTHTASGRDRQDRRPRTLYVRFVLWSFCPSFARCVLASPSRARAGEAPRNRAGNRAARSIWYARDLARAHRRARRVRRVLLALQDRAHARARACVVDCRPRSVRARPARLCRPGTRQKTRAAGAASHPSAASSTAYVTPYPHDAKASVTARMVSPPRMVTSPSTFSSRNALGRHARSTRQISRYRSPRGSPNPPVAPSGEGLAREPARQHVVIRNHALAHVRDVPDHQRTSVTRPCFRFRHPSPRRWGRRSEKSHRRTRG